MVEDQIKARGVRDERILDALRKVPRHHFVEEEDLQAAYGDHPLSIGHGQTISQPYIVAVMTEALRLRGGERILEVGTGSGYQTAVLAELAERVYTVEVVSGLMEKARERLAGLGYGNIVYKRANGRLGWIEEAPFHGIIVTAAPEVLPRGLLDQMVPGGHLVIPIGKGDQTLMRYTKKTEDASSESLLAVRFVPLV